MCFTNRENYRGAYTGSPRLRLESQQDARGTLFVISLSHFQIPSLAKLDPWERANRSTRRGCRVDPFRLYRKYCVKVSRCLHTFIFFENLIVVDVKKLKRENWSNHRSPLIFMPYGISFSQWKHPKFAILFIEWKNLKIFKF